MRSKIIQKYHFSPISLATTLKLANTLAGKGIRKEALSHIVVYYKLAGFHSGQFGNIYQNYKCTN